MLGAIAILVGGVGLTLVTFAFLVGRRELAALVRVSPGPLESALLVVIPARNEAHGIGACLDRVLADHASDLRVVVVDDRSTDDTATIVLHRAAKDHRLALVRLDDDPPAGTFGKPRALVRALEHARAHFYGGHGALPARLLFLDADVVLESGALGGLVHAMEASGAHALSGVPRLECRTLVEQLLVPTIVTVVVRKYGPTRVHDPKDAAAFLNGQLILVDTSAYESVGGFGSVSDTVLEDVALARLLKSRGHALRLADLRTLASTRMYATFTEIVAGFGKNATALLGPHAWATGLLALVTSLLPWAGVALASPTGDTRVLVAALAILVVTMGVQVLARRRTRAPLWPVLVLPLAYAGVAWVLVRASWRTWRKRPTTWKGREYL